MATEKVAIVGTGSSAEALLRHLDPSTVCDFYNSTGIGEFKGKNVLPLQELVSENYDRVILAVYDYGELLPLIRQIERVQLYWFNAKSNELSFLADPFADNEPSHSLALQRLTVVYDMRIAPPTYDFAVFLVKSLLVARQRGLHGLHVLIAPGDRGGFRENIDFFSHAEMAFRVTHLLLPLIKLVDPSASFSLCTSRKQARDLYLQAPCRFPELHNFVKPVARHFYSEFFELIEQNIEHRILQASEICRERIQEWKTELGVSADKLITLTLRESSAHHDRNSELAVWRKVAEALSKRGYTVAVIRDTSKALLNLGWSDVVEFPVAALDVEMRTALYEAAWLNLGVCNGPAVLCFLMPQCRYLYFGMYNASCTSNTYEHLEKVGIVKGKDQIAGAGIGQYICWDDITVKNVLSAIEQKFGVKIQ